MVSTAADLDRFFTRLLAGDLGRRMRPRGEDRYGLGLARFDTTVARSWAIPATCSGRSPSCGHAATGVLVVAANVFPLTPEQETALQLLLERAFCG